MDCGATCAVLCALREPVSHSCSNSPSWPSRSRCLVSVVTHVRRPSTSKPVEMPCLCCTTRQAAVQVTAPVRAVSAYRQTSTRQAAVHVTAPVVASTAGRQRPLWPARVEPTDAASGVSARTDKQALVRRLSTSRRRSLHRPPAASGRSGQPTSSRAPLQSPPAPGPRVARAPPLYP